jgi:hypothetical protein
VLVVLARSPDGASLDLALEPFGDAPVEALYLGFTGLEPGQRYLLSGDLAGPRAEVEADGAGAGAATVDLAGPARLTLAPDPGARR